MSRRDGRSYTWRPARAAATSEAACRSWTSWSVSTTCSGRDPATRVVLSKGHAAAGLYAALHATGLLEQDPVPVYGQFG